jgi:NAD(P)-dependent dehydrogenase (short-subunit alcohol dehydrogenase family)
MQQTRVAITGASRGIGAAVAQELRTRGVEVITSSRTGTDTDATLDVNDAQAVEAWFLHLANSNRAPHAVVHCAGICEPTSDLLSLTPETWQEVLHTNASGTFHVVRSAARGMLARGTGDIIVLGSRAGRKPHGRLHAYSASKACVLSLVQSVAKHFREEQSDVRFLSVSPGGVNTDMRRALFGAEDSEQQQSASDVARIIADILEHRLDVPSGADVIVTQGKVEVIPQLPLA